MEILKYGLLVGLAIALLFAAISDIRERRIANWLNIAIAAGAPFFWFASGMAFWPDMVIQLGLAFVVFWVFAGLFALGWLGGGDVKLLGAIALWLTPFAFLDLLLVMAVVGGAMAVFFVIRRMIWKPKTQGTLPYGVAITIGALWVLGATHIPASALVNGFGSVLQ
jgi:prepilin peptidase CpaA